jgi:hypothetical protein
MVTWCGCAWAAGSSEVEVMLSADICLISAATA